MVLSILSFNFIIDFIKYIALTFLIHLALLHIIEKLYPTIPTLKKMCDAFGITLSQIFEDDTTNIKLNNSEMKCIES